MPELRNTTAQLAHLPGQHRSLVRPVALVYRRIMRTGGHQSDAVDAAIREYQRLNPDAPVEKPDASRLVIKMIAAAINADTEWFWRGPDA